MTCHSYKHEAMSSTIEGCPHCNNGSVSEPIFDPEKIEFHWGYLGTQHDHTGDEEWALADDYRKLLALYREANLKLEEKRIRLIDMGRALVAIKRKSRRTT